MLFLAKYYVMFFVIAFYLLPLKVGCTGKENVSLHYEGTKLPIHETPLLINT